MPFFDYCYDYSILGEKGAHDFLSIRRFIEKRLVLDLMLKGHICDLPDSHLPDSSVLNMCPDTTGSNTDTETKMTRVKPMPDDNVDSFTITDFSKLKDEVNEQINNMLYNDFFSRRLDNIRRLLDIFNTVDSETIASDIAQEVVNSNDQETVNSNDQEAVNSTDQETVNNIDL